MESPEAGPTARLLTDAPRCLLAFGSRGGPLVTPMAFWWDGSSLWMTTAASSVKAAVLRRHPHCAVYVPPAEEAGAGLVLRGDARVYDLDDPVGLLLHAPPIWAAMTSLAVKNPGVLLGYAQDLTRVPARWLPPNRSVLRVRVDAPRLAPAPELVPGIAPPLPAVVPPDVRRALGGRRRVVLVSDHRDAPGGLAVSPAVWSAGGRLSGCVPEPPPPGTRAVAVLERDPRGRPTGTVGLALRGTVDLGGALRPDRVTWWHGFRQQTADVPAAPSVALPD